MTSKVLIIFVALIVCQLSSANPSRVRRDDEPKSEGNSGGSANAVSGTDSFMSNIGQLFGNMPTNPTEFVSVFSNFFKNAPEKLAKV